MIATDPTGTAAPAGEAGADARRRIVRFLRDCGIALSGEHVVAMCSGGVDSTVLVDLLATLPRGSRPACITVLACDHGLRDAREDVAAAHRVAASHGLDIVVAAAPPGTLRAANLQASARAWRYGQAAAIARSREAAIVATAHHADDQLETVLHALVAGAGSAGRAGMPASRELDADVRLVRPLLPLSRVDIAAWALARDIAFVDDPTNADPRRFVRNGIRHDVVPALLAAHPGAGANLERARRLDAARVAAVRSLAAALLATVVDAEPATGFPRLDVRRLADLDPAARREVVAAWLRGPGSLGRGLTERVVAAVDGLATAHAAAPGTAAVEVRGACVRRDRYHLVLTPRA